MAPPLRFRAGAKSGLRVWAAAGASLAGHSRSVIVGGLPSAHLAEIDRGDRQTRGRLALAATVAARAGRPRAGRTAEKRTSPIGRRPAFCSCSVCVDWKSCRRSRTWISNKSSTRPARGKGRRGSAANIADEVFLAPAGDDVPVDPICGMQVDKSSPRTAEPRGSDVLVLQRALPRRVSRAAGRRRIARKHSRARRTRVARSRALRHDHAHHDHHGHNAAAPATDSKTSSGPDKRVYYCPMDEGVEQIGPGHCPICGMAPRPEI